MISVPVSSKNNSIEKDDSKCIKCEHCVRVCDNDITVARMFEINPLKEPECVNCGQCTNMCPTEAIHERFDYLKVKKILKNKKDKIVCISVAPAVRVAVGEDLGLPVGTNLEKKIPTVLKMLGADYAFDITFGADLTVMEEAMEFVNRLKNNKNLPQFTSCCPAWVKYAEIFYSRIIPNLSTAKSPIAMQSSIIKTYFADKIKVNPNKIINIVIAPCTAKKSEITRPELSVTAKDTDYVLTTREFALLIKEANIDITKIENSKFDSPLGTGSGSGVVFGSSGGVAESVIRTAYYFINNENLTKEKLVFNEIRGMDGIKEATVNFGKREIRVAVCNGMRNAKILLDKLNTNENTYDLIEVMSCKGGCIAGGGQPKITLLELNATRLSRMNALYDEDTKMSLRFCHENPNIINVYNSFLKSPNGPLAEKLLHTTFNDKSYLLGGKNHE